jgi:putative membrane protein
MIWSTSHDQSSHSRLIRIISILTFGLVGGFFVARFGIMPGTEWASIVMMLGIAAISYRAVVRDIGIQWIIFLILSGLLALVFEYVWIQHCIPYGCFQYGDVLGAKIFQTVPWTVFVGWTPLIIGVYAILRHSIQNRWRIILIGAIILTLIDMVLDPGAVLLGFWSFDAGGWYYNVPWSNFAGWLVSGSVGMFLATQFLEKTKTSFSRTYSAWLTLSFFTWIAVFSEMRLPAAVWSLLLGIYFVYYQ